jgi:predicted SnoaL-like aldol condensation-catalyzing enzyme
VTTNKMKALASRMYQAANTGNTSAVDDIFAPDFHSHPMGTRGTDAVKKAWAAIRTKYPDLHVTVEDMLAEGDKLAVRTTVHGVAASVTGQEPTIMEIIRIEDGRIAELWGLTDLDWR